MSILNFFKKLINFKKKRTILKNQTTPFVKSFFKILWSIIWRISLYTSYLRSFLIITFVFSPSMTPTIHTNDLLMVSTIKYGYKIPFTSKKILKYDRPALGDVVILNIPIHKGKERFNREYLDGRIKKTTLDKIYSTFSLYNPPPYGKRIIGCAGDKIQMLNGVLMINGQPVMLKYIRSFTFVENEKTHKGTLYEETLPNGVKHLVVYLYDLGAGSSDTTEEFTVPEGNYLVMGDNRQDSADYRTLFGFVPEENILGKIVFVFFSNGNLRVIDPIKFFKSINWSDCLKIVK